MTQVEDILPPPFAWCEVTAGKVTLKKGGYVRAYVKEFDVKRFAIAKYPITNAQFQVFVDARDGYADSKWWDYSETAKAWRQNNHVLQTAFAGDDHPRTNVSWYEAIAFCRWLSAKTELNISLPSEQQWQRAAQGDDGRAYPWGNTFDKSRCNVKGSGNKQTSPVTQYEGKGESPFGVVDMIGNVWEWCVTKYQTGGAKLDGEVVRSLRGCSWSDGAAIYFRADYRHCGLPFMAENDRGFRIVRD
jgi:formylglycine-generating enzyme required for sulfatase activity